ncbi:MAG TPA: hypothetical protein VH143_19585 [Kofleriaceae bacterium]|nr:hypothetical protein [Kofleriaceae bacterium]
MKRVVAMLACGACSTASSPPPVAEPRPGIDVRIVPHDELMSRTTSQQPIELPFGQSQNGTELVVALLQRARVAGASYVGDVAFHMVFKWRGSFVECETKLGFGDAPAPAPPPAPAADADAGDPYSTEVKSFEPHEIAFVANERDLECKQVAVTRETEQRRYASRFDGEVARKSDDIPIDTVMVSEHVEQCSPEHVQHQAVRYDYQMRLEYVPPDWRYLGATYAGGVVSESPPLCYAIDASSLGAQPTHRVTATFGFRGAIEQLEPLHAPSSKHWR